MKFASLQKMFLALFLMTFFGCQASPDFEKSKAEILDLHKTFVDAHWNKDVDFFSEGLSENYFSVGDGEIRRPTQEEIRAQFVCYLNNTTFTEYRFLQEPIIGFSKDGSMAWSIAQIKVAGQRTMDDGSQRDMDFICAWITLWEREGDQWVRLGEVSTFN